jgi:hypothetical protein
VRPETFMVSEWRGLLRELGVFLFAFLFFGLGDYFLIDQRVVRAAVAGILFAIVTALFDAWRRRRTS